MFPAASVLGVKVSDDGTDTVKASECFQNPGLMAARTPAENVTQLPPGSVEVVDPHRTSAGMQGETDSSIE